MEDMKKYKRMYAIVYDSLGVGGNDPMAKLWNDQGSNTFKHINEKVEMQIPMINKMGIEDLAYETKKKPQLGHSFRSFEKSNGKDTIAGHWEMMGLITKKPFVTYLDGFPQELINELESRFGKKIIGNKAASGMPILRELGMQETKEDKVIVYTSSDSVLQICGNENHMGLEKLYEYCDIAREVCNSKPEWKVARIIARPYIGETPEEFKRTANRKDLAIPPVEETVMDIMSKNSYDVISIGKISDIFSNKGITKYQKTISNDDGMKKTIDLVKNEDFTGFAFINLVDFDSLFGHPRDTEGYGKAIEQADVQLTEIINNLKEDDLLIVTADHGNDPTWTGNDHTREMIPIMNYSPSMKEQGVHEDRNIFGDIGATVLDNFGLKPKAGTKSFLSLLK